MTQRGATTERICKWCGGRFTARVADVNRGWARFCSKSCKASHQEKRTNQYRIHRARLRADDGDVEEHIFGDEET
jgi:hypothetical protein